MNQRNERRTRRNHHRFHHGGDPRQHLRRHLFSHGRAGRSVRRGNVRLAILHVLADGPMHGYQIINELESRTQGRWRPSAGSVYPTLQLLEDEGLISAEVVDGRKTYTLTDAGRQAAAEHPLSLEGDASGEAGDRTDARHLVMSLMGAVRQLQRTGSPEARRAGQEILIDARRRIYRLLADDDAGASGNAGDTAAPTEG